MRAPRRRGAAVAILAVGCWCHKAAGTPTSSPSAAAAAAAGGGARELPTGRRLQAPGVPTPWPTEYDPDRTPWPTEYDPNRTPRPTEWPTLLPTTAPTLTSAPTAHEYQDNLVAYYPMTHGKLDDAHASGFHGKAKTRHGDPSKDEMAADLR